MNRAICIGDIVTEEVRNLLGNRCFISGAVAIGGTTSKVKLAAAVDFSIDGILYHKAITDDLFVHTDLTVQAADTVKYYVLSLDKTGAALITQGNEVATADVGASGGKVQPYLPKVAATQCVVGAIKVATVAVTFTPATNSHADSGITTTYFNLSCVPTAGIPA